MPCKVEEDYEIAGRLSKEYTKLAQITCLLANMIALDDEVFSGLVHDTKSKYAENAVKWVLEHRDADRRREKEEHADAARRRKITEKRERKLLETLKQKYGT